MRPVYALSPIDFGRFSLAAGKIVGGRRALRVSFADPTRRWRGGWLLAAALSVCAGLIGGSGSAGAQSLTEALAEAYRTNPQLLAQRALLRATDELVPQARANWRPTVAFTGQTGYAVSADSAARGPTAYSHSKPSSLDVTAMRCRRDRPPDLRLPVRLYDMGRHYKAVKDKWIGFAGGLKEYGAQIPPR
jgi:hypothetical protein